MQDTAQRIAQVINDREHGSRWLVREAIIILRDLAESSLSSPDEQLRLLYQSGQRLARGRPAMAALASAVSSILSTEGGPAQIAEAAEELLKDFATATQRIAIAAQPVVYGHLLTCSISGTVLDVLKAHRQQIEQVTILEGRPRYEGREMARALSQDGFVVTLITDAQADIFLPQCTGVVVGADSVLASGDILNKSGTALLAWAARGHAVPFYVLCETLKISPQHWLDDPTRQAENLTLLEEKEAQEVWEQVIPGITVHNYYFDRTPAQLVTQLITEQGVVDLPAIQQIANQVQMCERLLMERQV